MPSQEEVEWISSDEELQLLIRRAARLTFGIFGTRGDAEREVRGAGSGILVAPSLAITARHVITCFYEELEGRKAPRYRHQTSSDAHLFQVLDPFDPEVSKKALWRVDKSWTSSHTDISLLQVSEESDVAKDLQGEMPSFFEWKLCPPPAGATVLAIGYPQHTAVPDGSAVRIGAPFSVQRLQVKQIHALQRDKGFINFPCFEVDATIERGFSGGPVFYENRLCGVVSAGSNFDERSHIATLWPLTLMDYDSGMEQKTRFGDLLDRKVVVATDWSEIRGRISKGMDGLGVPYLSIDSEKCGS